jgi:predicted O-methyltransferase YrrM
LTAFRAQARRISRYNRPFYAGSTACRPIVRGSTRSTLRQSALDGFRRPHALVEVTRSFFRKLTRSYRRWRGDRDFRGAPTLACDTSALARGVTAATIERALHSQEVDEEWRRMGRLSAAMHITDTAGGVNPGDRRAIYYLMRHFEPCSVLEIGTHIGASTLHIAAALRAAQGADPSVAAKLTTVDIVDVNNRDTQPWLQHGSARSPLEMAREARLDDLISFVNGASLDYLAASDERFDFIFLDGDHAARTVYAEVPAALRALRPGGLILLHDYFPRLGPLWSNRRVIGGPWLATERLRGEGAAFEVLPLG